MRIIAAMLTLVLLFTCAAAEGIQPENTVETLPAYMPADMEAEEIHAFIELMFAAATGTTADIEKELRADMTVEEIGERNAANAAYRARTLPWLIAVFRPEGAALEPTPEMIPEPTPEATLSPEALPVYTVEDSFTAFSETEAGMEYLALMETMGGEDMEMCLLITREICNAWMAQVDHEMLSEMNGDYRCWIYAPGTQIDYPVVHGEDNSYYLKRMFNGEKNSAGTLFIDYRNLTGFQDPNTLIYGHHMRNDSMFGTLTDYVNQAYYEAHPYILLMSAEEICIVQLFAGYTTNDRDHCYDIAISDEEDMRAFLNEALRKTNFLSFVQVEPFDRLVTLSTCAYAFEDARYIALGRLETVWRKEMTADDAAG